MTTYRPQDAVDWQSGLLDVLLKREPKIMQLLDQGVRRRLDETFGRRKWTVEDFERSFGPIYNNFIEIMANGETIFVSTPSMAVIQHAAGLIPAMDTYDVEAPKYKSAFILFETDSDLGFHRPSGVERESWLHWVAYRETVSEPRGDVIHIYYFGIGASDRKGVTDIFIGIADNRHLMADEDFIEKALKSQDPIEVINPFPAVMALWGLFDQPVMTTESRRLVEPKYRKMRKARRGPNGTVNILNVRRREPRPGATAVGGTSLRQYSHRWIVSGHWKMQAYGEGRSRRRRIWIDSYVAGPDDLPLGPGDRVRKL